MTDGTWVNDGHTVTFELSTWLTVNMHWTCPFNPDSEEPWPFCRIEYDEGGYLVQTETALDYCNVGEYVNGMQDGLFDVLAIKADYWPRANPFPVSDLMARLSPKPYEVRALTVECPRCKAKVGSWCIARAYPGRQFSQTLHEPRRAAVREETGQ